MSSKIDANILLYNPIIKHKRVGELTLNELSRTILPNLFKDFPLETKLEDLTLEDIAEIAHSLGFDVDVKLK